ncbi:MAG TPA: hypothetical protein VJQ25_10970 [Nitrospira sp.]|nr:hypothetical protein [Nitrospira sp.]
MDTSKLLRRGLFSGLLGFPFIGAAMAQRLDKSSGNGGGGISGITVKDGSTTVSTVTTVNFSSGATVSAGAAGTANVAVSGGGGGYSGPLDIVSGAAVAYSNRALSSAMRGSQLYTLRHDSTPLPFISDFNSGIPPVFAIQSFLTTNPGFAQFWQDQSGNGAYLSCGGGAVEVDQQFGWGILPYSNSPVLGVSAGQNSPPSNDSTASGVDTIISAASALTWFIVAYIAAGSTAANIFNYSDESTSSFFQFFGNDAGVLWWQSDSTGSVIVEWDVTADCSGLHIWEITVGTNGAVKIYKDGVDQNATISTGVQSPIDAVTGYVGIGIPYIGSEPPFSSASGFYEIISYQSALSDGNRTLIRENIANWYGIALP